MNKRKASISQTSEQRIGQNRIPLVTLQNGSRIPCIGLGTFGSDSVDHETVATTVEGAIASGYRHIDCASVYGNEKNIGRVFGTVFKSGSVKRDEMWITSKVWNDMHDNVAESCRQSLSDLQLAYLDLYLVHWPFPNYHPPGCDVTSRSPDATPFVHEKYMKTWRQMEKLVDDGLVRNIGTSNMTVAKLKLLLRDARIKPVCNEMELHPHFQQPELFEFCVKNHIQPIAYCPLGSPGRPERDRTPEDTVDLDDDVIVSIAARLHVSPAQVAIQWAIRRGQIPIPFSVHHYIENLDAVTNVKLTDHDLSEIARIDKNSRLIKGQVFLWKESKSWEDLWDLDGAIAAG